jgi:hypothetical protein
VTTGAGPSAGPGGRPLFRPEAVAHHASGRTERRTLDLGERRTRWLFRLLVLLVAAALVTAYTVRADVSAKGAATVRADGRTATVFVPAGALGKLRAAQPVRLHAGGTTVRGEVTGIGEPVSGDDGAYVPVTVALDAPAPAGHGTATVRLARHTLAHLLLGRG